MADFNRAMVCEVLDGHAGADATDDPAADAAGRARTAADPGRPPLLLLPAPYDLQPPAAEAAAIVDPVTLAIADWGRADEGRARCLAAEPAAPAPGRASAPATATPAGCPPPPGCRSVPPPCCARASPAGPRAAHSASRR